MKNPSWAWLRRCLLIYWVKGRVQDLKRGDDVAFAALRSKSRQIAPPSPFPNCWCVIQMQGCRAEPSSYDWRFIILLMLLNITRATNITSPRPRRR